MLLTGNLARSVVRLHSDGNGGVQTMKWDMANKRIHLGNSTYDGDVRSAQTLGEPE